MISVIVPVYNAEKCVRKYLDSIVGQTYKDLEILIVEMIALMAATGFVLSIKGIAALW